VYYTVGRSVISITIMEIIMEFPQKKPKNQKTTKPELPAK
jgi:hypothetical protein